MIWGGELDQEFECGLDRHKFPMAWATVVSDTAENAARTFLKAFLSTDTAKSKPETEYRVKVKVPNGPISSWALVVRDQSVVDVQHRCFVLATDEFYDPADFLLRLMRLLEYAPDQEDQGQSNDAALSLAIGMLQSFDPAWVRIGLPANETKASL